MHVAHTWQSWQATTGKNAGEKAAARARQTVAAMGGEHGIMAAPARIFKNIFWDPGADAPCADSARKGPWRELKKINQYILMC